MASAEAFTIPEVVAARDFVLCLHAWSQARAPMRSALTAVD